VLYLYIVVCTQCYICTLLSAHSVISLMKYKDISSRLCRGALAVTYGRKQSLFQGPHPVSYSIIRAQQTLTLHFDHPGVHLRAKDGFEVKLVT